MLFSILGAWGLWLQNLSVWKNKSGKSVSVSYFSFFIAYFLSGLIYGLDKGLLALTIHCIGRLTFGIPILIGLWKFKIFTLQEKILCYLFWGGIAISLWFSIKEQAFMLYSVGSIFAYLLQAIEIFKNKDSGRVVSKLHWVYFGSASFWTIYGFANNDLVLKATSPPNILIALLIIVLCHKYKKPISKVSEQPIS